jgi:hypothetical protein
MLNKVGAIVAVLYLLGALIFGPKLAFTNEDKQDILARIEGAATGKEASLIARPFLGLMMNVINSGNGALLISCGVVFFSGCVFFANAREARKSSRERGQS